MVTALLPVIVCINLPPAKAATPDTLQHLFDTLTKISEPDRSLTAIIIYKNKLRKPDEIYTFNKLNNLYNFAGRINDKRLQWAVYNMRADYYSIREKLNNKSTAYYIDAINFARENSMVAEEGIAENNIAVYFFINKKYSDACRYFLQSLEKFKQAGYGNVPEVDKCLFNMGSFYYKLDDFDNARPVLEDALRYAKPSRDRINYKNTLGLVYRNLGQFKPAIDNFQQALKWAVSQKDTVWVGIIRGNIGSCYLLQGKYTEAIPYVETDYKTSLKYNEGHNAAIALLRLVKINLVAKQVPLAGRQLDTAYNLLKSSDEDVLKEMASYYDLKAQWYEQLNQPAKALICRKSFEVFNDSLIRRNNLAAIARIQIQYEKDERNRELSKFEADERISNVKTDAGIALLMLMIIIMVLVYNRQRMKNKKDTELLLAEKTMIDERLKNARVALQRFTENIRQKNLLIDGFKQEIEKLNTESANKSNAHHLEQLLQAHIMTDENWAEFKRLFSMVYPGFFVDLSKNNPNLSTTDTRIIALMKLGLNNAEMADMLGITIEGIKKAKQRLRKKMDNPSPSIQED